MLVVGFRAEWTKRQVALAVETYALHHYNLRIQIGALDYELFPLHVRFFDFKIQGGKEDKETFLHSPQVRLQLPYSNLWSDSIHIYSVMLASPEVEPRHIPM